MAKNNPKTKTRRKHHRPSPEVLRALGQNVRVRRAELGIRQEVLADRARLERSHIGLIEVGSANPTLGTLEALAKGLDLTLSELTDFAKGQGRRR